MSETALEIFLMQITNILLSLCQAVELRWIKSRVVAIVEELVSGYTSAGMAVLFKLVPWFRFFCSPEDAVDMMLKDVPGPKNAVGQNNVLVDELSSKMNRIRDALTAGKYVQEIANEMGQGKLYLNHVS
jgi:hypothetical protein